MADIGTILDLAVELYQKNTVIDESQPTASC